MQDTSIGAIYDLIRNVNREVARLSGELLEGRGRGNVEGDVEGEANSDDDDPQGGE